MESQPEEASEGLFFRWLSPYPIIYLDFLPVAPFDVASVRDYIVARLGGKGPRGMDRAVELSKALDKCWAITIFE